MAQKKRRKPSPAAKGTSSNPYTRRTAPLPKQIESASSLWLDFFQQFCEMTVARDWGEEVPINPTESNDKASIVRARILADHALEAFQERFPGVHP